MGTVASTTIDNGTELISRIFHKQQLYIHFILQTFKGTAHLKQHSYYMAIFSSGLKIFRIAFQDVVDNSWKVPVAHFSATNCSHMTLFLRFGETFIFHNSGFNSYTRRLIFVLDLGNGLDVCDPQNRPCVFQYMVKFSIYDIVNEKNASFEVDFIFFVTLGNDVNWISTNQGMVLKYRLCTLT